MYSVPGATRKSEDTEFHTLVPAWGPRLTLCIGGDFRSDSQIYGGLWSLYASQRIRDNFMFARSLRLFERAKVQHLSMIEAMADVAICCQELFRSVSPISYSGFSGA